VSAALTAAETGHLVLSSLHTQDAVQTIERIIDIFPEGQQRQVRLQLSGSIQGIISQQLLPMVSQGGRVVAHEVLISTPGIANVIRESKTQQIATMLQTGQALGMHTMDQRLAELVRQGTVSRDTAMSRAVDPSVLAQMLDGRA